MFNITSSFKICKCRFEKSAGLKSRPKNYRKFLCVIPDFFNNYIEINISSIRKSLSGKNFGNYKENFLKKQFSVLLIVLRFKELSV